MQIDFYHWGGMCPLADEFINLVHLSTPTLTVESHDLTKNFALAREKKVFFPFLTVVDHIHRYYAPITGSFMEKLKQGILPVERPYCPKLGQAVYIATIEPITRDNYTLAKQCTGRKSCGGCNTKLRMYDAVGERILGFVHREGNRLLGGAEFYPSMFVPYDIPHKEDTAFITCVYGSDETFDYKSAPLEALEGYLSETYRYALVVADEESVFPNGDLPFFLRHGYRDKGVLLTDDYCRLHLLVKNL